MRAEKLLDEDYEERRIVGVTAESNGGWSMKRDDGWSFYCPPNDKVMPRVGDIARFYGRDRRRPVRGLDIASIEVFYRTKEEQRIEHARLVAIDQRKKREDFDARRQEYEDRVAALPVEFRARFERFTANNPDFPWEFGFYELSSCEDAVKIADWAGDAWHVENFQDMPWDEQNALIPDLWQGHSGNSFGFAVRLAHHYLTDKRLVAAEHGALSNLVGCKEYGCPPVPQEIFTS